MEQDEQKPQTRPENKSLARGLGKCIAGLFLRAAAVGLLAGAVGVGVALIAGGGEDDKDSDTSAPAATDGQQDKAGIQAVPPLPL